jgi:hypothetical protein
MREGLVIENTSDSHPKRTPIIAKSNVENIFMTINGKD